MPGPGSGGREMNFTATIRDPPLPSRSSSALKKSPAGRGLTAWQSRQRRTAEQVDDSAPVVPSLDAPVPLMAEQLVDVLSLIAKCEKEMDRIEDLILVGSPVSTADREAWRRWANSSSSGAMRKKKRKRKLPKTAAVHRQAGGHPVLGQGGCRARYCATTGLGKRSWCTGATDHGHRGGDSACACLRGPDRGPPAPQIMEVFVEEIQLFRDESRSWCANATDHGGWR